MYKADKFLLQCLYQFVDTYTEQSGKAVSGQASVRNMDK